MIHGPQKPTLSERRIPIRALPAAPGGHIGDHADPLADVQRYVSEYKQTRKRTPPRTDMRLGYVVGKKGPRGFQRNLSTSLDLLDILRRSESRACSVKAIEKDYRREQSRLSDCETRGWTPDLSRLFPDRYVSLHHHYAADYVKSNFHAGSYPTSFNPVAVRWVGVDLDGLDLTRTTTATLAEAAKAIERWCESRAELTGRMALVRTSSRGVQVLVELAATRWGSRRDSPYASRELQTLHNLLDRVCLESVRAVGARGGHADTSIRALGRYVRLPGPRMKDGALEYARLAYASA